MPQGMARDNRYVRRCVGPLTRGHSELGVQWAELVLVHFVCVCMCVQGTQRAPVCVCVFGDSESLDDVCGIFHIHLTSCDEKPGDLFKKIKIKHHNCTWDYFALFYKSV